MTRDEFIGLNADGKVIVGFVNNQRAEERFCTQKIELGDEMGEKLESLGVILATNVRRPIAAGFHLQVAV